MASDYKAIVKEGIWDNNGVLSMMLGLCPAMAMTNSATNGLGMGLATMAVMGAACLLVSLFRKRITPEVRIPVFILISAAMVTIVDLAMNAWMHELYKVLGLFIPLIVVNCLPMARFEAYASKSPPLPALADGLAIGLGFTVALTAIGALREVVGSGTLFADASLLLGPAFKAMELRILPPDTGILMMILPPGAFFATALAVVAKRLVDARLAKATALREAGHVA
jgi:electron transport complex protein RnfE